MIPLTASEGCVANMEMEGHIATKLLVDKLLEGSKLQAASFRTPCKKQLPTATHVEADVYADRCKVFQEAAFLWTLL